MRLKDKVIWVAGSFFNVGLSAISLLRKNCLNLSLEKKALPHVDPICNL
jgi:hypothetical protein